MVDLERRKCEIVYYNGDNCIKKIIIWVVNRRFHGRKLPFTAPLACRRKKKFPTIKTTIYLASDIFEYSYPLRLTTACIETITPYHTY